MICRGCSGDKKLVKSHIIPESFFRDLREGADYLKLISPLGEHSKRSPIGVYDKEILCRDCEDRFQSLDSYAAKTLLDRERQKPIIDGGKVAAYRLSDIDCDQLKLFFVSLVWRASISKQPFYGKVNLGPLEKVAKNMIWNKDPAAKDDFSFVLARFDGAQTISKAILDPHPERFFRIRYYRFYLGGYVLYIKSDSRETPKTFDRLIPEANELIILSRGNMEESKEFTAMVNVVKSYNIA